MPGRALFVLGAFGTGVFGSVDHAVIARAEIAAGVAPEVPGADPEPTLTAELTPGVGLRARNERTSFVVHASPRFHYRVPNLGDVERPLVLGRGGLRETHRVSEVVTWSAAVDGAYGEIDYSNTLLAFDTPVARDLFDPIVEVRAVDGTTELEWRLTETQVLEIALVGGYTRLVTEDAQALPETTMVGLDLVQRWQLDEVSSLSVPLSPRYFDVEPDPDTLSVSLQVLYERLLSRRDTLTAAGGFTVLKQEDRETEALPRGALSLSSVVHQRPGFRLTNTIAAGLDVVLDPTLGELRPVAQLSLMERAELGTSWTVSLEAQGFTSATREPLLETDPELARFDRGETDLRASLLAAHRAASWLRLDFGVRASTQASHFAARDFRFIDEQIWVFAGMTLLVGIGSAETPDWMQ